MNATGEREQVRQEVELAGRELDVRTVEDHPARCAVDAEGADRVVFGDCLGLVGIGLGAAKDRMHAGQNFANRKRFGDVVVGTELEPDDLVDLRVLGRDDDDRHAAALPEGSAEVEPAHPRQHQVEQDEIGPRGAGRPKTRSAVASLLDGEAGGGEVVLEHVADALVVLDDEDAAGVGGRATHPSSTTWPVSRKTMSSATLVTRSAIRSRL